MKKFTKNNEGFTCKNCGKWVEKHPSSSRDHCNHCLYGMHVDINPGDRLNQCRGLLKPIGLKMSNSKEQIVYECLSCKKIVFCIKAKDDNPDQILCLSNLVWKDNVS